VFYSGANYSSAGHVLTSPIGTSTVHSPTDFVNIALGDLTSQIIREVVFVGIFNTAMQIQEVDI
jgi:hypothetical protein